MIKFFYILFVSQLWKAYMASSMHDSYYIHSPKKPLFHDNLSNLPNTHSLALYNYQFQIIWSLLKSPWNRYRWIHFLKSSFMDAMSLLNQGMYILNLNSLPFITKLNLSMISKHNVHLCLKSRGIKKLKCSTYTMKWCNFSDNKKKWPTRKFMHVRKLNGYSNV
jgi:hypothetical protein